MPTDDQSQDLKVGNSFSPGNNQSDCQPMAVVVNGSPRTKRARAGDRPMAMQYGTIPGLAKKVSRVVRGPPTVPPSHLHKNVCDTHSCARLHPLSASNRPRGLRSRVPSRVSPARTAQVYGTLFLHTADEPHTLLDTVWESGCNAFDCAKVRGVALFGGAVAFDFVDLSVALRFTTRPC